MRTMQDMISLTFEGDRPWYVWAPKFGENDGEDDWYYARLGNPILRLHGFIFSDEMMDEAVR